MRAKPTIVLEGQIVGAWQMPINAESVVKQNLFVDVPSSVLARIQAEFERIERLWEHDH